MANDNFILTNGPEGSVPRVWGTEDGVVWTGPIEVSDVAESSDIAFDGASTVCVSLRNQVGSPDLFPISRSTNNAVSFALDSTGLSDQDFFFTVNFGGGQFVAGGFDNLVSGTGLVFTSPGNGSWTSRTNPFATGTSFNEGVYASHYCAFNTTYLIGGVTSANNGGVSTSADAIMWSALKVTTFTGGSPGTPADIKDFADNGVDVIFAVGTRVSGNIIAHGQRSLDSGNTWSDMTFVGFGGAISAAECAAHGNGIALVGGTDDAGFAHLERSIDDGVTWVEVDISDILPDIFDSLLDLEWSSTLEQFILAGATNNFPLVALSPTGLAGSWTVATLSGTTESSSAIAIAVPVEPTPVPTATVERDRLVRDPWDIDEWGRFYPGAGFHKIT